MIAESPPSRVSSPTMRINERENQLIEMANLTSDGLETVDVTGLLDRFGMNIDAGVLSLDDIRGAVDDNYPTILAIQAYADEPDTVYTDDRQTVITLWRLATMMSDSSSRIRPAMSIRSDLFGIVGSLAR